MATQIGSLFYKITGDTSGLDKSLKKADKSVKKTGGLFKKFGADLKGALIGGSIFLATKKILQLGVATIQAGSDAEETRNKFDVVFRDVSDAAEESAKVLDESFGLSNTAALDLLSSTGDLLTGFGFTQEASLDLATEVNQLAVDLASFTNFSGGAQGASEALTKALLGERESVKALGISILDADVKKQVAIDKANGLTFATERQAKAQATLTIALSQSKNAQGDFARSQNSMANKSREAQAAIEDLKTAIGTNLLPVATSAVTVFASLTQELADLISEANDVNTTIKELREGAVSSDVSLEALTNTLATLNARKAAGSALSYDRTIEKEIVAIEGLIAAYGIQDTWLIKANDQKRVLEQTTIDLIAKEEEEAEKRRVAAEEAAAAAEKAAEEELAAREKAAEERLSLDERSAEVKEELIQNEADMLQDANELAIQNFRDRNAAILASDEALAAAQLLLNQQKLDSATSLFGGLSLLLGAAGKENRAALIAQKAFSAVQSGINSGVAFTKTLADGGPFPFNVINAAGVLAAGIAQQVQILATPIPGFENGGIIPGNSLTGDKVPIMANSQEEVLRRDDPRHALNGGSGGTGDVYVYIGSEQISAKVVRDVNNGKAGVIDSRVVR